MANIPNSQPQSSEGSEAAGQLKTSPICHRTLNPILVGPGEWIRSLGSLETFMEVSGKYGSANTVQAIWLSSRQPINPTDVQQALLQTAQKIHILQVCVQRRLLKSWFKRMEEVACDFDVEEGEVMAIFHEELQKSYDFANGPLWRAKLVPIPQQSPEDPHQASLIFSAHHCIVDAHTVMLILRTFLQILNASLTGIDCEVQVRPVIPVVAESLWGQRDWYFLSTYFFSRLYGTILTDYSNTLYFGGALKPPQTKIPLTKVLRKNFTVEETKELRRHCKENGVTIHSCIMATANLALLKTAQERAENKVDTARIKTANSVSLRRYFPDELKESAGCHISIAEHEMLISGESAESKEQFWSLAKVLQNNLSHSLSVEYTPIRVFPLFRLATMLLHLNYGLTKYGLQNHPDSHINITNMGCLKQLLPSKYNGPVEITDLLRSGTNELNGNPFTLSCHTFDERFMISINYYTHLITAEDAILYFSYLKKYISNIIQYGTVQEPVTS